MIITGNRILDALDVLKERLKTLDAQFKPSLFRFEDEQDKRDPREILQEFEQVNQKIARLQEAQAAYNLRVEVEVLGERMSLQRILQLIGAANKVKAHWLSAASPEDQNIYNFAMNAQRSRDKEHEYAQRVVPLAEAQELADMASRRALAYKQAIRSGNAREVEMDVPADLFEV
jgi:hypothetical protein